MKDVLLYIADKPVARLQDGVASPTSDYSLSNPAQQGERMSSISEEFTVFATPALRRALGFPEDLNAAQPVGIASRVLAEIRSNGEPVMTGLLLFLGATTTADTLFYRFKIKGDNSVWAEQLAAKRLLNLDLYAFTHPWTQQQQEAAELPSPSRPYIYPLIQTHTLGKYYVHAAFTANAGASTEFQIRGALYPADFSGHEIEIFGFATDRYNATFGNYIVQSLFDGVNSRIIVNGLAFNGDYGVVREYGYLRIIKDTGIRVRTTDRYPAIRISYLLQRLFNDIGYRLQSRYNEQVLAQKYLHHNQNAGWLGQQQLVRFMQFKVGIQQDVFIPQQTQVNPQDFTFPFDDTSSDGYFDNGLFFDTATHHYQPRIAFRQNFHFAFAFEVTAPCQLSFIVQSDALGPIKSIANQSYSTAGTYTVRTTLNNFDPIAAGDGIRVIIRTVTNPAPIRFLAGSCFLYNEVRYEPRPEGSDRYLLEHLPDVSQLDFLLAILDKEGLEVMTDTHSRTVYLEPSDEIIERNNVQDWTGKTVTSQPVITEPILEQLPKGLWYKYAFDENDKDSVLLRDNFNIEYGSLKLDFASPFKSNEYQEVSNELFAATHQGIPTQIGFTNTPVARIVTLNHDDKHLPRILYYAGKTTLSPAESWTQGSQQRTDAPIPLFTLDQEGAQWSEHYADGLNTQGLAFRNFRTRFQELQHNQQIRIHLHLTPSDIAHFNIIDDDLRKDYRAVYLIQTPHAIVRCRLVKIQAYDNTGRNPVTEAFFIPLQYPAYAYSYQGTGGNDGQDQIGTPPDGGG